MVLNRSWNTLAIIPKDTEAVLPKNTEALDPNHLNRGSNGWDWQGGSLGVRQYPRICLRKARTRAELAFWASNVRIHKDCVKDRTIYSTSGTEWFLKTNSTTCSNLFRDWAHWPLVQTMLWLQTGLLSSAWMKSSPPSKYGLHPNWNLFYLLKLISALIWEDSLF